MSFLSKLLGSDKERAQALNDLKNKAMQAIDGAAETVRAAQQNSAAPAPSPAARRAPVAHGPWGDEMPQEENQYSFNGTYTEYFDKVFREDFPAYARSCEADGTSTVFTLFAPTGARALVVELKSENSSAQKIKKRCAAEGVPYLRFYYNHHGWWNARSYVDDRVRRALNG